jgi:hypothetical protein
VQTANPQSHPNKHRRPGFEPAVFILGEKRFRVMNRSSFGDLASIKLWLNFDRGYLGQVAIPRIFIGRGDSGEIQDIHHRSFVDETLEIKDALPERTSCHETFVSWSRKSND